MVLVNRNNGGYKTLTLCSKQTEKPATHEIAAINGLATRSACGKPLALSESLVIVLPMHCTGRNKLNKFRKLKLRRIRQRIAALTYTRYSYHSEWVTSTTLFNGQVSQQCIHSFLNQFTIRASIWQFNKTELRVRLRINSLFNFTTINLRNILGSLHI